MIEWNSRLEHLNYEILLYNSSNCSTRRVGLEGKTIWNRRCLGNRKELINEEEERNIKEEGKATD